MSTPEPNPPNADLTTFMKAIEKRADFLQKKIDAPNQYPAPGMTEGEMRFSWIGRLRELEAVPDWLYPLIREQLATALRDKEDLDWLLKNQYDDTITDPTTEILEDVALISKGPGMATRETIRAARSAKGDAT